VAAIAAMDGTCRTNAVVVRGGRLTGNNPWSGRAPQPRGH
jgi:hypothetical protein